MYGGGRSRGNPWELLFGAVINANGRSKTVNTNLTSFFCLESGYPARALDDE